MVMQNEHKYKYKLRQIVYLITDSEQSERLITGITIRPGTSVSYELSMGIDVSWHFAFEISETKDILKSITTVQ